MVAVINLQEPGEHKHCGSGILSNKGFSYSPELLTNKGIWYLNIFWEDL